ncbi:MAG: hypothetical protein KAU03_02190 [Candidatus Altiarchaeales archaeon]|nr:hypothetical protein [Candidatus Altiarchaeales archaeon]
MTQLKSYDFVLDRYVRSIEWLREEFSGMDDLADVVMGIRDWDDAVCVEFGGKSLLVSVDGPYKKRLVMKSALIHASTDVVVKGGKPLFALDTLIGGKDDVKEMALSLKNQALAMEIPLLGGNTMFEDDAAPRANITVVGGLVTDEPIRDSGAREGDFLVVVGEPIWGSQRQRIDKAINLFETWSDILHSLKVNAAKDVTKGGLAATIYEISAKSEVEFKLEEEIGLPMTRNLDNFLISISPLDYRKVGRICKKRGCWMAKIGEVF